ncbi:hypothetical protein NQ317_015976 [Molorchus minor]|uniref:Peptidase S1 domain-containing protein n=1 Tax=Molorchus minor TaxID=1323400 RepID=A0ABQ9JVN8_9CUCU|nr:hypothetical protein NQ317_015976 [Molorchus minor]
MHGRFEEDTTRAILQHSQEFHMCGGSKIRTPAKVMCRGALDGEKATPGVYVNVPQFIDWIDKQLYAKDLDMTLYKY